MLLDMGGVTGYSIESTSLRKSRLKIVTGTNLSLTPSLIIYGKNEGRYSTTKPFTGSLEDCLKASRQPMNDSREVRAHDVNKACEL
jgi:hypothetical protein